MRRLLLVLLTAQMAFPSATLKYKRFAWGVGVQIEFNDSYTLEYYDYLWRQHRDVTKEIIWQSVRESAVSMTLPGHVVTDHEVFFTEEKTFIVVIMTRPAQDVKVPQRFAGLPGKRYLYLKTW
ncbi:MAG: hypothetical protein COT81_04105 [Candidatus Buchananbacteria bacterium CG10_big_fil_rev_8_21_14_0_10_42_9]|uniref:Uncharacterized protein n=1 Tax=Candidatus Buchananbacteria bacterium CG10_big_fil_rev_8_21_14_0_10_42_9 TaxID=1974526 RepID=A0A2H0W0M0_9BACT|nr:MAG: hypothetical protein COT81_04105 [Candidatus Buchananbacteria bacterium CG10_big_fil_rev_8_21_14_0_10_42_9]